VPIGNESPELAVQLTTTGSLTPFTSGGAGTLNVTFFDEVLVEAVTSGSGPNDGGVVSWTVTLNPPASVPSLSNVHETGVVMIPKCVPEGGVHVVFGSAM